MGFSHISEWERTKNTRLEAMLSYAFYLFIEHKHRGIRQEAEENLQLIIQAARLTGIAEEPAASITENDLLSLKPILTELDINDTQIRQAFLHLLKFIHPLNGQNIVDLNLIEIAGGI